MTIYNYEEIFENIPGDSANVILNFPPEMIEGTDWKEGDVLNIEVENGTLVISKKE